MSQYDALRAILGGRFIAYSANLARAVGGVHEAILLQQLCYWSERTTDPEGWFYKTSANLTEETALNRYQQDRAREALRELGVIEEVRRGMPAKMYFRVDWDVLLSLPTFDKQVRRRSTNKSVDGEQTGLSTVSKQVGRRTANMIADDDPTITESTSESSSEMTTRATGSNSTNDVMSNETFIVDEVGMPGRMFWQAVVEDIPAGEIAPRVVRDMIARARLVGRGVSGELIVRPASAADARRIQASYLITLERAASTTLGAPAKILIQVP